MEYSIGDLFISDLKRQERESELLDDELKREQQEQLLAYMDKKAMSSGDTSTDNTKYMILGAMGVIMLAVLILKT